jgi:prolipoprotein diacylglyceryltransferase
MDSVPGQRLVFGVYGFLVALAGGFGYFLGAFALPAQYEGPLPPAEFGPVAFRITPLTMALYGAVVVGVGFGVLLALVAAVSRRADRDHDRG